MPKKTKKEKLLAQQRRVTPPAVVATSQHRTPEIAEITAPSFTLPPLGASTNKAMSPKATAEFSVMKRDIAKTLLITAVILISEFILAGTW